MKLQEYMEIGFVGNPNFAFKIECFIQSDGKQFRRHALYYQILYATCIRIIINFFVKLYISYYQPYSHWFFTLIVLYVLYGNVSDLQFYSLIVTPKIMF